LIPPDHVVPTLSKGVGEVIELMMAKKPEDRYSAMKDLLTDLEAIARGEPPLQARKKYDAHLLEGLAESAEPVEQKPTVQQSSEPEQLVVPVVWVIVLAALFGVSLIVNIILAVI